MESSDQIRDEEVPLQFCTPRAVKFDTTLLSNELGPQRNIGEETRTKITQKEYQGGEVIASIARICYGTFKEKKAVIIVIQLLLKPSNRTSHLQHLEVEVSFEPRPGLAGPKADSPIVRNLSPRKVYGIPDASTGTWSFVTQQQWNAQAAKSGTTSSTYSSKESTPGNTPSLVITGRPWSDQRRREMHKACWVIQEKGEPGLGIPDEVNIAMIAECESSFQANVKISLDIPLHRKLLAFPWTKDDPIIFPQRDPGPFIGEGLGTIKFEKLSDVEWAALISGHDVRS